MLFRSLTVFMKYLKLFFLIITGSLLLFAVARADYFEVPEYAGQVFDYPYEIEVLSPSGISLEKQKGVSAEESEREIAIDLGITVYPEDQLEAFPFVRMKIGSKITIHRAPKYTIYDGKKEMVVRSWKSSVSELFSEKKIILGADDKINFSTDTEIEDGMVIRIIRVEKTKMIERESIIYKIIEKEDPELKYGKTRIEAGEAGEKKFEYLVTREDGEEVSRVLLSTEVVKQPKNQVKYIGTKIIVLSSVRGKATITNVPNYVVSATYKRGSLIRITNTKNGVSIVETVNATWGTAAAPAGVVLDLSMTYMNKLKWDGIGAGPSVLVEEIER